MIEDNKGTFLMLSDILDFVEYMEKQGISKDNFGSNFGCASCSNKELDKIQVFKDKFHCNVCNANYVVSHDYGRKSSATIF